MVVLDMATSTVTWGHLLVAARRGVDIQRGVAMDGDGRQTTSPRTALQDGALLPLGGTEETGGYKGYGLALLVDILTGVLASANFGSHVIPFSLTDGPSNLGQLFMAIDPESVDGPGFEGRLESLLGELVSSPRAAGARGPVLIPGQIEAEHEARQRADGVALDAAHHDSLVELGARLGREFPAVSMAAARTPPPGGSGRPE
jgi:LDH2 family malate/lactate/ureidoglycolate dehydrogenase